jgi:hypothetical protein
MKLDEELACKAFLIAAGTCVLSFLLFIAANIPIEPSQCLQSHTEARHKDAGIELVPHFEVTLDCSGMWDKGCYPTNRVTMLPQHTPARDWIETVCDKEIPAYRIYDWFRNQRRT